MQSPIETDLRPREFAVALLMAATWYFAGPWGLLPTLWFLALIVGARPQWGALGRRLLPVTARRALRAHRVALEAAWGQLSAPWREGEPPALPEPAPGAPQLLAELLGAAPPSVGGVPGTLGEPGGGVTLPAITLAELAAAQNILIVGSPGSGKSTLLHALIARRPWRCYVLDPHNHPGKWPDGASIIGGGRGFQAIYAALGRAEAELDARAKRLNSDAAAHFAPFTLAGDEWGSVCSEISVPKDADPPGRLLTRLLKEGRKFGIAFLGAAHGDTAASLGSSGDTQAFRYCFDAIVYTGGFVAQQLKDQPALVAQLPLGQTAEGKRFPLIVVVVSPVTGERRLLDLRAIPAPARLRPEVQLEGAATISLQTDEPLDLAPPPAPPTSAPAAVAADEQPARPVAPPPALSSREDIVRLLVRQGWTVSQIREVVKGDNSTLGALVRRIEDEQLRAEAQPAAAAVDEAA